MVFVLDKHKKPLMPCTPKKARLLLSRQRAVVHRRYPFVIRLKDRRLEESVVQPLVLKIDPVTRQKLEPIEEVIIDVDAEHSGVVVQKLSERRGELTEMRPSGGHRLRLVFYGDGAPPNVAESLSGDLALLPDRPAQAELQKLRKAVEQWRVRGAGAPPASKVLAGWLAASGADQVAVDSGGSWLDPERTAQVVVASDPGTAFRAVNHRVPQESVLAWPLPLVRRRVEAGAVCARRRGGRNS